MFIIDFLNRTDNVLSVVLIWAAVTGAIALAVNMLRPKIDRNYVIAIYYVIICELALFLLILAISLVVEGFGLGFGELVRRLFAACALSGFGAFLVWWLLLPHKKRR